VTIVPVMKSLSMSETIARATSSAEPIR